MRIVNDIVLVNSRCVSLQDKWLRIYLIGNIVRIFEPHQSDLWLCQTIKSKERMNCISEWIFWHVETKQLFYWFGNQKRLKIKKRFQSQNSLYSQKVCFIFLIIWNNEWILKIKSIYFSYVNRLIYPGNISLDYFKASSWGPEGIDLVIFGIFATV